MSGILGGLRESRRTVAALALLLAGHAVAAGRLFGDIDFGCGVACLWYFGSVAVSDGKVYHFSDCDTVQMGFETTYICYYTA
jgi:hypothetical protein